MDQEKKKILYKYLACLCVGVSMVVVIFAINDFDFDGPKTSMRILHDAFFTAGALMSLFAGLLYASGEGAFLGIGYALKGAIRVFVPVWRKEHETFKDYRERKIAKAKPQGVRSIFFTGLFFLLISIIFLMIWRQF